jgi:hypothetical protein
LSIHRWLLRLSCYRLAARRLGGSAVVAKEPKCIRFMGAVSRSCAAIANIPYGNAGGPPLVVHIRQASQELRWKNASRCYVVGGPPASSAPGSCPGRPLQHLCRANHYPAIPQIFPSLDPVAHCHILRFRVEVRSLAGPRNSAGNLLFRYNLGFT